MTSSFFRVIVSLITFGSIFLAPLVEAATYTPSRYGGAPAQLVISNTSSSTSIGIYWVDLDGIERFQRSLSPNSSYTQDTYINHVWNIRDNSNGSLLSSFTVYASYQQQSINPTSSYGYSTYGNNRATKIYFNNNSNITIDISWLSPSGVESNYRSLRPGETYTQDTYMNHVWIIRDNSTRRELARTTSTNDYQTYTYSQNQPTYNYNYQYSPYGYNNNPYYYTNYRNTTTYGDDWNHGPVSYVYSTRDYNSYYDDEYEDDWYDEEERIYSVSQACRLRDGTYNGNLDVRISGRVPRFDIEKFQKKGTKITFSGYETLTNGRSYVSKWTLNCKTKVVSQR